jgi:hypothetical protein
LGDRGNTVKETRNGYRTSVVCNYLQRPIIDNPP